MPGGGVISGLGIGPFTVVCLENKPLSGSEAQVDFVLIQTLLLLYANRLIVMPTSFWCLSYQGHHKPRFHSEAWLHISLSTETKTLM